MSRLLKSRAALALCAVACLLILGAPRASADTIYRIDNPNSGLSGYTGPYASVDVHLTDSTHATITYTSLTNSGNIYLMGDGGSVGVNVNATSWTLGSITGSNGGTGFSPGPYSDAGAGNEDGFGRFNQTIDSFDGFTSSSDTISFVLTNTSGTWASSAAVLTPNSDGNTVAAHIFVTGNPANAGNGALVTGFATTGAPVPEPASMALMGTFLLGAYGVLRRKLNMAE